MTGKLQRLERPADRDAAAARFAGTVRSGSLSIEPDLSPWGDRMVLLAIAVMTGVRLGVAAAAPLAPDEVLYWRYSRHLAAGYIDHPGLNPLMIRIGTSLLGDAPLGVRLMSVLSALLASWAIWRAAAALFDDERIGATAALLLNFTLVLSIGSIAATSDEMVVVAACLLLAALAKLCQTSRGVWWLAIGAALGLGLCAKYTMVFFGVGVVVWVAVTPGQRRWIASPWTWAGAAVALAIASPVVLWNAQHDWASFYYQSGRLVVHAWSARYAPELLGSLVILLTPPIFLLACVGLWRLLGRSSPRIAQGRLLGAFVAPMLGYFLLHSLHERVQGNWPEPAYPALAIAAAFAARRVAGGPGSLAAVALWTRRLAAPFAIGLAGVVYLGAAGLAPHGAFDPRARFLSVGWDRIGPAIEAARARTGARMILAPNYELASLVAYYLPSPTPVEQITERVRWANEPAPDPALEQGPVLFVCENACPDLHDVQAHYRLTAAAGTIPRISDGRQVSLIRLYRMEGALTPVLDPRSQRPRAD